MVAHSHAHSFEEPHRPRLAAALAVVVGIVTVGALVGMLILWPSGDEVPEAVGPYAAEGVEILDATVDSVEPFDCGNTGVGPDNVPVPMGDCATVTATVEDGATAELMLDPTRYVGNNMQPGDAIQVVEMAIDGAEPTYELYDFERAPQLIILAIVFAVLVVIVARWRGLFGLLGIGIAGLILLQFILPALLAGKPAIGVAVVGSTVIMIAVLYLAHGVSIRTTSALLGTLFGVAFVAVVGAWSTDWAHLTGIGSEDDRELLAVAPEMSLSAMVAASMVIAGLGVLNDVTVTQASAVWEMRGLQPTASRAQVFRSAMRIGRDHIASSVYTLVFAYAGSALGILLLVSVYQQGLGEVATAEHISQEIVRTLVGAIGLVLVVPVTNAIAVALAPSARAAHA